MMFIFVPFQLMETFFREDCYAPLALQVVAVEHLPAEVLPVAEQVSGEHHLVHQRCLSVVNVGNDGYVTDIFSKFSHFFLFNFYFNF